MRRAALHISLAVAVTAVATATASQASAQSSLALARQGETTYTIAVGEAPSPTVAFAGAELSRYLERITGAEFPVAPAASAPGRKPIVLRIGQPVDGGSDEEAYSIAVRGDSLLLTGASDRAVLYAAYDLLARLGCEWIAPAIDFYEGAAEVVPQRPTLVYESAGDVVEDPVFAFRKIDVEEGLSHDTESLLRIVEWMPKVRYNTLQVPMDYGGTGRVRWDAWREALTPELEKRGILIEVGGHGYQNFLNAEMEGGTLFETHPEWFGMDAECRRTPNERMVFNTANADAVDYLVGNVLRYLRAHPEIDIFDFWPPDGVRWAECPDLAALGTAEDRQARLVNRLQEEIERAGLDVRLEIIAYAHTKLPPRTVALHPEVLVDFCPIGQNFDAQIDDPSRGNNVLYVDALRDWRATFPGEIGLYSYYRKYAWRSLPVVIPHYMQQDLRWYAALPLQGISTYAEPADWFTYELNHFALAHLAWNPAIDLGPLLDRYARARYGAGAEAARAALSALEDHVRVHGSIPYSEPRAPESVAMAEGAIAARAAEVRDARAAAADPQVAASLDRLGLMMEFAARDLEIQRMRGSGATPAAVGEKVEALVAFLTENADRGVFLLRGQGDLGRYLRHYDVNAPE